MGWTGYEITIPADVIFKKMYCHKCGKKMKKSKSSIKINKGGFGFSGRLAGMSSWGMSQRKDIFILFLCPICGNAQTTDRQMKISRVQEMLQKKILTEEEIANTTIY